VSDSRCTLMMNNRTNSIVPIRLPNLYLLINPRATPPWTWAFDLIPLALSSERLRQNQDAR